MPPRTDREKADAPSTKPLVKLFVGTDDGQPEATLSSEGTVAPLADAPRTAISVIVTVYNHAAAIAPLMEQLAWLEQELTERGLSLELVFVDDGSRDRSFPELVKAKAVRPATKIVKLARSFGAPAAARAAQAYATGDGVTVLSADLQDPVEKVLEMVDAWRTGARFVVCERPTRKGRPLTRLFGALSATLIRYVLVDDYPAGDFDLRLFDRAMLPYVQAGGKGVPSGVYAYWLGFEPTVLPFARHERPAGKSRWPFSKRLAFLVDTLTGLSVAPIRAFTVFGLAVTALSALLGLGLVTGALLGKVALQGTAPLALLIAFFSGTILTFLGVLGEYVWRILEAVTGKPDSVIEQALL